MATHDSALGLQTRLVHAAEPRVEGATTMPIFASATYLYKPSDAYEDVRYIRQHNQQNQVVLSQKLAAIEGGEAAVVTSSGMGAIAIVLSSLLRAGDHLLIQSGVYGGTYGLVTDDLPAAGVEVTWFDSTGRDGVDWNSLVKPNTKVVYVEALSNPLLQMADLPAVVQLAKRHGLVSVVDSTFATPVNLLPLALGLDVVVHSATKYLNGHSDIAAGVAIARKDLVDKFVQKLVHTGALLDPHAAWALQRGVKTLALRVRQHNANALELAACLEKHPLVRRVHFPALPSHPQHELAQRLMPNGCGGVFSFEVDGSGDEADAVMQALRIGLMAPSLGALETLVCRPAVASHGALTPAERQRIGIADGLLRVAVGIEDAKDLTADFNTALDSVMAARGLAAVKV